ncbi:MAG: hypothetical protein L3K03_08730, partial [Thermoplasmata archaeon]|nr:hypothetical protein [Thermoplasmata archaeon]
MEKPRAPGSVEPPFSTEPRSVGRSLRSASRGLERSGRRQWIVWILFATAVSGMFLGVSWIGAGTGSSASSLRAHLSSTSTSSPGAIPAPLAAAGSTGTFYQNDSSIAFASFASKNKVCQPTSTYCDLSYEEASSPDLLNLEDGKVGMSYQVVVNTTQTICGWTPNETVSHIGFTLSSNGGVSFGSPAYLGDKSSTCPYNQELEPSFTTNSSGSVLGVYIGADSNATDFGNQSESYYVCTQYSCYYTAPLDPVNGYTNRTADAVIFVNSSNNGTTFSNGSILLSGSNLARPAIAAFGETIYVAYENINNSTTPLPGGEYWPISVNLIASTNGGSSWSAPVTLPGENATDEYNAMSPSISISSSGAVAVAYDTNRTCLANCTSATLGPMSNFGDDVVAATSTDNGSTWALHTIYHATGEPTQTYEYCSTFTCAPAQSSFVYDYRYADNDQPGLNALFEFAPPTAVAWNTTGSNLFVAWGGSSNQSEYWDDCSYCYEAGWFNYGYQGLYEATSYDGGMTWSSQQLGYTGGSPGEDGDLYPLDYYNIGLVVANGTAYLAYQTSNSSESYENEPGDTNLCGFPQFDAYDGLTGEWLRNSTDGRSWSSPIPTVLTGGPGDVTVFPELGYRSSVVVREGKPIVATSLPPICTDEEYGYCYSYTEGSSSYLDVATVTTAASISLTINETGVPIGTAWIVEVSGNLFSSNNSSLTVTNVPKNGHVIVEPVSPFFSNGTEYTAYTDGGSFVFPADSTVSIGYTAIEPFHFVLNPSAVGDFQVSLSNATYGFGFYYEEGTELDWTGASYVLAQYFYGCPMPWSLPVGFVMNVRNSDQFGSNFSYSTDAVPSYWSGIGNGSYSGLGDNFSVVMNNSIYETMWTLPLGYYGEDVSAPGLPASSTFSFDWDGVAQSGTAGGGTVTIPNVPTGVHWISDPAATSSQPGWIYVGSAPEGGAVIVPQQPVVNLTFAYVDVGSPAGIVSFHAPALSDGTDWQLSLNGTTYSSDSPWINVTTHSGTYSYSVGPAAASNGSVGYAATAVGSNISVTVGDVYTIDYAPAYKVTIATTVGGTVAPTGEQWDLPGQTTTPLVATAGHNYAFVGWSGTGLGSYSGMSPSPVLTVEGPIVETANFAPLPSDRFDLNFTQSGVPTGVAWQVNVGGTPYSSKGTQLVVPDLDQAPTHYEFGVPYVYGTDQQNVTRYVPETPSGNLVAGTNYNNTLVYQTQHYLTVESASGGTATAQPGNGIAGGSSWFTDGMLVTLSASPNAGYTFAGWVGTGPDSYTGGNETQLLAPSSSITELATFAAVVSHPPPLYTIGFDLARPVAVGTDWTVTIGTSTYASTGTQLNVSGLSLGTVTAKIPVTYSPDGLAQYTAQNASVTIRVSDTTIPIEVTFGTAFWVNVYAIGSGTVSTGSSWVTAGQGVSVLAIPNAGSVLTSWTGSGVGSYSGPSSFANLSAEGPITEVATFDPVPVAQVVHTAAAGSFANSEAGLAVLAVLGLALGAVIGLVLVRGGSRRPPPPVEDGLGEPAPELPPESPIPEYSEESPGESPPPFEESTATPWTPAGGPVGSRALSAATSGSALAIVAILFLGAFAGVSFGAAPPPGLSGGHLTPSPAPLGRTIASPSPTPTSGLGTFWVNHALPNVTNTSICQNYPYYTLGCGPTNITNEPSLNLSDRGVLVAAYTAYTNSSPCETEYPELVNYTQTQVGVITSTDGGATWSTPHYLGNPVCSTKNSADRYLDAWQPSVTSLGNGTLVVAYVQFNVSMNAYQVLPDLSFDENSYGSSRLVVDFSYDNGSTWSAPKNVNTSTISAGYYASANWIQQRPSISAVGQTIYLAWTNLTVGYEGSYEPFYCTTYGFDCGSGDSGVQLAVSKNGGTSFNAPIHLPVNASSSSVYDIAANPSVLTTANGTLVVAYMTNVSWNSTLPDRTECYTDYPYYSDCGGFLSEVMVAQST